MKVATTLALQGRLRDPPGRLSASRGAVPLPDSEANTAEKARLLHQFGGKAELPYARLQHTI
jgi:hypothetical protein